MVRRGHKEGVNPRIVKEPPVIGSGLRQPQNRSPNSDPDPIQDRGVDIAQGRHFHAGCWRTSLRRSFPQARTPMMPTRIGPCRLIDEAYRLQPDDPVRRASGALCDRNCRRFPSPIQTLFEVHSCNPENARPTSLGFQLT